MRFLTVVRFSGKAATRSKEFASAEIESMTWRSTPPWFVCFAALGGVGLLDQRSSGILHLATHSFAISHRRSSFMELSHLANSAQSLGLPGLLVALVLIMVVASWLGASQGKRSSTQQDNPPAAKESKVYTKEEVARHNKRDDCWVIIKNKVYDLTSYVDEHPGGDAILNNAGEDATEGFYGPQHASRVFDQVEEFFIGDLVTTVSTYYTEVAARAMAHTRHCANRSHLRRCCIALILSVLALAHSPAASGKPNKNKNKRENSAGLAYYSAMARGTSIKSITAIAIAESIQFELTVGGSWDPPYNVTLYRNPAMLPSAPASKDTAVELQTLAGNGGTEWLKVVPTVWETYGSVLFQDGTDTMTKELAPGGRPQLVGEYTVETVSPPGYSDEPPKLAVASLERGNAKKFGNPGQLAVPLESPLFSAALVDAMTGGAYVHITSEASQYNLSYVVAIVDPEEDPLSPLLRIYNDTHAMPPLSLHCAHSHWANPRMGLFMCAGYLTLDAAAGLQYPPGAGEVGSDSGGSGAEKKGGKGKIKFLPGVIGNVGGGGNGGGGGGGGGAGGVAGALGGAFAAIGKKLGGKKGGKKGGTANKNHPQSLSAGASSSSIKAASLSDAAAAVQPKQPSGAPLSSQLKDKAETAALSLQTLGRKGGKKGGKGGKGSKTGGESSGSSGKKTKGADPAADAGSSGGSGGADAGSGSAGDGTGSNGGGNGAVDEDGRVEMPYLEAMASLLAYGTDGGGDGSTYYEVSVFGASRMCDKMASRRRFPTSVVNHRCRGTPDCTCAFCQDSSAIPAASRPANPAATSTAATAGTAGEAPRLPSLAEEAAALRAAVDFGGAAPDYWRRERGVSQSRSDGLVGDRTGPAIDGVARGATGGESRGGEEEAKDAQSKREMAAGRFVLTFATGTRGRDVPPVPTLLQLCVGEVGRYLPHLLRMNACEFDLRGFVALLPPHARLALTAIARRRGLLSDWLLEALVDDTWQIVDLSGSDVSDQSLCHVAQTCPTLVALDIRECNAVSLHALTLLLKACPALQVLRMGGSPACNKVARAAVKWMLPQQPVRGTEGAQSADAGVEGEEEEETVRGEGEGGEGSWEEVEELLEERVPALRWLVWPEADPNTAALLASKCPRILLNPAPPSPPPPHSLPLVYSHIPTFPSSTAPSPPLPLSPISALPSALLSRTPLQAFPRSPSTAPTWSVKSGSKVPEAQEKPEAQEELSIAERFRLAFVARNERLAPKRAKNQRQRERREGRDRAAADVALRARLLAGAASRSLRL
ncbi:unnamed protein product [Closterium sp. Yama58-4]|nr:unnamed protein product [Closterium sp. Yama58-4]